MPPETRKEPKIAHCCACGSVCTTFPNETKEEAFCPKKGGGLLNVELHISPHCPHWYWLPQDHLNPGDADYYKCKR